MNQNYIIQGAEIDLDFTGAMYAMYMQGEWGIEVGYKVQPLWYVGMRKQLFDYQVLCSTDCNNELRDASYGHYPVTCCSSGSTLTVTTGTTTCCPDGFTYNGFDCERVPGGVTVPTFDCPCCPIGYTYIQATGICQGVNASDIKDPINCPSVCLDAFDKVTAFIQCPDRIPDTILLSVPTLGDNPSMCCETQVIPWTGNCGGWNNGWLQGCNNNNIWNQ